MPDKTAEDKSVQENKNVLNNTEVESYLDEQDKLDSSIRDTRLRRMAIESVRTAKQADDLKAILNQPLISKIFSPEDISNGLITNGSQLEKVINSKDPLELERYLFQKAIQGNTSLAYMKLSQIPDQLLSQADNQPSLVKARKHIDSNLHMTVQKYLDSPNPQLPLPLTESLISAHKNTLTAKMALKIHANEISREDYWIGWAQHQEKLDAKITFSPTYKRVLELAQEYENKNGKARTLARLILFGPYGRGKSKELVAINKLAGKNSMIISGRLFLGYEELVASPKIVSSEVSSLADLANAYHNLDPYIVTQNVLQLAQAQAERITQQTGLDQLSPEKKREFSKNWLCYIGLGKELAQSLSSIGDFEKIQENKQLLGIVNTYAESIKKTFIAHLLLLQTKSSLIDQQQEATKYLKGLIITADELGLRVIIDEAEKMFTKEQRESGNAESFAGLEDILTMRPGQTLRIGNINHRFSEDFCIDLTMNERKVPPHILSRFGERAIPIEEQPFDRLAIALAELVDTQGNVIISPESQEKLTFFLVSAWPIIEKIAQERNTPWDLRTLQSILSSLAHSNMARETTVPIAIRGVIQSTITNVLTRFPALTPDVDINSYLAKTTPLEVSEDIEKGNPLLQVLTYGPVGVDYPLRFHIVPLSPEEIQILSKGETLSKTEKSSEEQLDSLSATITLVNPSSPNPSLIFTLPSDPDKILYQTDITIEGIKQNENIFEIISASSWSNTVLLRKDDLYFTVDCFGLETNLKLSEESPKAMRNSPFIEKPNQIILTPEGTHLLIIEPKEKGGNINQLIIQRLGTSKQGNKEEYYKPLQVNLSPNYQPSNIRLTQDGNYALITMENLSSPGKKAVNILNLKASFKNEVAQFIFSSPLEGEDWQIESFENTIFLFNTKTTKGVRIN